MNLKTRVRRDLPPEIYATREFVISFRKSPRDFPEISCARKEIKSFPFKICGA